MSLQSKLGVSFNTYAQNQHKLSKEEEEEEEENWRSLENYFCESLPPSVSGITNLPLCGSQSSELSIHTHVI